VTAAQGDIMDLEKQLWLEELAEDIAYQVEWDVLMDTLNNEPLDGIECEVLG
jgi:hypothetical protein